MINLCIPAIIYIIFSITQIIIDTYKGLYNTAVIKIIIMIMITILLQILCERGLNIISWIIVFIPFILMTVITSIILYVFGLNATSGKIDYECNSKTAINNSQNINQSGENIHINYNGDIIIYDPNYDAKKNPVYYKSPNIIIPYSLSQKSNISPPPRKYSTNPMFQ